MAESCDVPANLNSFLFSSILKVDHASAFGGRAKSAPKRFKCSRCIYDSVVRVDASDFARISSQKCAARPYGAVCFTLAGVEPRAGIEPAAFALPRRRCPVPSIHLPG